MEKQDMDMGRKILVNLYVTQENDSLNKTFH